MYTISSRLPTKLLFIDPHLLTKTTLPATFLHNTPTTTPRFDPTKLPNTYHPPNLRVLMNIVTFCYTPNLPISNNNDTQFCPILEI